MSQTQQTQSTGPRTEAGKAISSQNALKHGLASGTLIIEGEKMEDYLALLNGFTTDFAPVDQIETALVHEIAKAYWLKDRALRFQAIAFNITAPHLDKMAAPMDLPVLLRYQIAQERTFYRALKTLQTTQKERKSEQKQFVSKSAAKQTDKPNAKKEFVSQKLPTNPDELIVALAYEKEALTNQLLDFAALNPDHPGVVKSTTPDGFTTFKVNR
jgi:hypothetical protein